MLEQNASASLTKAAVLERAHGLLPEYRAAIALAPSDTSLHIALADTLYYEHKYRPAIDQLTLAIREEPDDPFLYAQRAHAEAELGSVRPDTVDRRAGAPGRHGSSRRRPGWADRVRRGARDRGRSATPVPAPRPDDDG